LCRIAHVSEDTIRRDLTELAAEGKVRKVRGGAVVSSYHPNERLSVVYAQENKVQIAQKALQLIENDMFVLIGGGTTIRELIRLIPDDLRATFITVNPVSVLDLMEKPNIETILIGGKISPYSQMSVGGEVFQRLSEIKSDLCLLGTNALHPTDGMTDSEWETVQVKKAMIKSADKTAVLAISEKLDSSMRLKIADLRDLTYLITELDPKDAFLSRYTEGVTLM
jgi:DeoR/GlpR family transcriptional regulator of sugar metabolism